MSEVRRPVSAGLATVAVLAAGLAWPWAGGAAPGDQDGPAPIPDAEFRRLLSELSEPERPFRSDSLVSNEGAYQHVIPALAARWPGGAYIGVGPDQNFTYVAATRPSVAFIVDIRRDNQLQHLLFKVLFERSADRVVFLSRLFSRAAPPDAARLAPGPLFDAYAAVAPDPARVSSVMAELEDDLPGRLGLDVSAADLETMRGMLEVFARFGPSLTYASTSGLAPRGLPTFGDLQLASDLGGARWGYLASAEAYATVRAWQQANLIIPVVGDFAGTHALAAVGRELSARGAVLGAFYASNVEEYLFGDGRWPAFYRTLDALPRAGGSLFIRATSGSSRLEPLSGLIDDVRDGKIRTYADITSRGGVR